MKCPKCNGSGVIEDDIIEPETIEAQIGILNKAWGLKGYKTALPGHPVFNDGNRYVIYLESETGNYNYRVAFYKETLKSWINFS